MKRALVLCLTLGLLLLTACAAEQGAGGTHAPMLDGPNPDPAQNPTAGVAVAADDIFYCYSSTVPYESFLYVQDGRIGVLSAEGEKLTEAQYTQAELVRSVDPEAPSDPAEYRIQLVSEQGVFWLEADGTLVTRYRDVARGHTRTPHLYFDEAADTMRLFVTDHGTVTEHTGEVSQAYLDALCPELEGRYYAGERITRIAFCQSLSEYRIVDGPQGEKLEAESLHEGRFAIYDLKSDRLLTDFVYERYTPLAGGNAYAVENGQGVTYLASDGAEVKSTRFLPTDGEGFYEAANGYIPVLEGEVYGLLSMEGRFVALPQFEDVTSVNEDGVYFAKKDGTWNRYCIWE